MSKDNLKTMVDTQQNPSTRLVVRFKRRRLRFDRFGHTVEVPKRKTCLKNRDIGSGVGRQALQTDKASRVQASSAGGSQTHPKHAQWVICPVSMPAIQELEHFQLPRIVYRSLQHGAVHYLPET